MGNDTLAGVTDVFGAAIGTGFFGRRTGEDFFFIALFSTLGDGTFGSGWIVSRYKSPQFVQASFFQQSSRHF